MIFITIFFIFSIFRVIIMSKKSSEKKSQFPVAIDLKKVGEYPGGVFSGGGYFYDDVLEYRVWIHPEAGGEDKFDGNDYFHAFATYEEAFEFSKKAKGSEDPIVLVLQKEWINEPEPGKFLHKKGERMTEWLVDWLKDHKRNKNSIPNFLKQKNKKIK